MKQQAQLAARDVFAWLAAVARSPDIGHFAVRTAVVLSGYFSRAGREAWPKQTTLADALNATPEGVRKGLLQLRDAGFLEVRIGKGRGDLNRYVMVPVPAEPPTAVGASVEVPPTASGVSEAKPPTAVGGSPAEPPTAVGQNPQQPFAHGTSESEPVKSHQRDRASRRDRETPLPADFPTVELITQAQSKLEAAGCDAAAQREAERFRDHHAARGSRFVSWPAAWSTWTGNTIDFTRRRGELRPATNSPADTERFTRWISEWRDKPVSWKRDQMGPRPDEPYCRVPDDLLRRFGVTPAPRRRSGDLAPPVPI